MVEQRQSSQALMQEGLAEIGQILSSKARPPFAYPRTREFLQGIIAEGGTVIPKALRDTREGNIRARGQNMIGAYFGSQATLEDVGQIYRNENSGKAVTRQAVQQVIKKGMKRFWENSSDHIKKAFPYKSIPLDKPPSLKFGIRQSLARGGTSLKLLLGIQLGNGYQELREAGINGQKIDGARKTLRRWGFSGELPYDHLAGEARRRFIEQLEAAQTPQEVRKLFKMIKTRSGIDRTIHRGNLPLTKLNDVLVTCGLNHRDSRNKHVIIDVLEADGVVVGYSEKQVKNGSQVGKPQRYYFIRTKDVSAAEQILRNNPS